jgi:hypothetical protein
LEGRHVHVDQDVHEGGEGPAGARAIARGMGHTVSEAMSGFTFNADIVSVIRFLEIGIKVDAKNLR